MSKRKYEEGRYLKRVRAAERFAAEQWLKEHGIAQCQFHTAKRPDPLKGRHGGCEECRASEQPAWTVVDTFQDWQLEEMAEAFGTVMGNEAPDIREMFPALSEIDAMALNDRARGFSWAEMAELEGISPTAARKRFERARQHLLALLAAGQGWDESWAS